MLKNWCFWTVVLEKTLESPLDCKEIQPVHPKGDQPWVFFGRNDATAETPVLWPLYVKSWLTGKDCDAGRDWGQEEKGTAEDEMAGWHHRLHAHEFEWTPGVGDGQGGLACCDSWCCKESDATEQLDWTELRHSMVTVHGMVTSRTQVLSYSRIDNRWIMDSYVVWVPVCVRAQLLQLHQTLCDPMDCTPPGSSVHGILQARILEWVAMPFSRGHSWPRDWIHVFCIAGRFFTPEPLGKPYTWGHNLNGHNHFGK